MKLVAPELSQKVVHGAIVKLMNVDSDGSGVGKAQ